MSSGENPTAEQQAIVASGTGWERDLWFDDDISKHPVVRELRLAFPDDFQDAVRFRNETTIYVTPARFRDIALYMRDHDKLQVNFLSDLTAVDMLSMRTSPRFDVTAQLYSIPNRTRVRMKASINDGETIPSLVPVFNGANVLERECYDMFGIFFEGHPNMRRILLQEDWDEGHPLRKDYPTRGWKDYPIYNKERTVRRTKTRWTGRGV